MSLMTQKVMITLLMLVIAAILFVTIWMIFKDVTEVSSEQKSFATAEKLKSAIEEACFKNIGREPRSDWIKIELHLPQPLPFSAEWQAALEEFVGRNHIKIYGDPRFIVYYEMLSPGEGASWEFYHEFDYRVIAMLPPGMEGKKDFSDFVAEVKRRATEKIKDEIGEEASDKNIDVIIGNVKISEAFDPIGGEATEKTGGFFGYGEWDHDNFIFDNYFGMSSLNKTFLKYQPCGNNTLCIKTEKGIFTYPLEYCKDAGIEYIQFVGTDAWGGAPLESRWDRHADLYFASPCKIEEAMIYLDNCNRDADIPGYVDVYGKCDHPKKQIMYEYNEESGLQSIGEHMLCLGHVDGKAKDELSGDGELNCVRVVFKKKEGHCFSYNEFVNTKLPLPLIDELLGKKMIKESTEYFSEDGYDYYILKPVEISSVWEIVGDYFGQENPVWP